MSLEWQSMGSFNVCTSMMVPFRSVKEQKNKNDIKLRKEMKVFCFSFS